ncbi:hypothetical protein ACL02S_05810 [Nocardia sp. 004]|uniref:hypothetical protein n=1 Tax=Nocardia sp. 004 TaxID=3385978 RepID=UPI0039A05ACB
MVTYPGAGSDGLIYWGRLTFANAYEYIKINWDEFHKAFDFTAKKTKESDAEFAARNFDIESVKLNIVDDVKEFHSLGEGSRRISPNLQGDALEAAIRSLDGLGFGDGVAAAYHAREHIKELPGSERVGRSAIEAYQRSAAQTVRTGVAKGPFPEPDGVVKIFYYRSVGNEGVTLRAIVKVTRDGTVRIATYGKPHKGE